MLPLLRVRGGELLRLTMFRLRKDPIESKRKRDASLCGAIAVAPKSRAGTAAAHAHVSKAPQLLIAICAMSSSSVSPASLGAAYPLVPPQAYVDRSAAAAATTSPGAADGGLSRCPDFVSDTCSAPSPQGTLYCSSSASAEMCTPATASCTLVSCHAAAASAFASPANTAAAQRSPPPLSQQSLRRSCHQRGIADARCCRRCLLSQLPPRGGDGRTRGGCCNSARVAAVVMLWFGCVVSVAGGQQELCASAWSTAALSVARHNLAATSLPNQGLVILAGGGFGLCGCCCVL